jgi:hypothetical protein
MPLVAVIVGIGLMAWSFTAGISAALSGAGSGSLAYQVIFIGAAVLVLASLIIAVINLVKGNSRALSAVTIAVAFVPIIAVVVLAVQANA